MLAGILLFALTSGMEGGTVSSLTALPGTITFSATEPESGSVAGSSSATVHFTTSNAASESWTLKVQAGSTNFSGCTSTVPASAVTVTCNSISDSNNGSRACSAPLALSSSLQQVAGGTQASQSSSTYDATISFTFADNWKYQAQGSACTLSLTYQVTSN